MWSLSRVLLLDPCLGFFVLVPLRELDPLSDLALPLPLSFDLLGSSSSVSSEYSDAESLSEIE